MDHKTAIILAAGMGTRMKSEKPKVLHKVMGKPMVSWVISQVREAGIKDIIVVVGHKSDEVIEGIDDKDIKYVLQEEQLGTGHAVMKTVEFLPDEGDVFVLCGDTPLIRGTTLNEFGNNHDQGNNTVTVLTAEVKDPFGYGRIVRNVDGGLLKIVEEKDAVEIEKQIHEINSGIYVFDAAFLKKNISSLKCENAQNEYYITDLIAMAVESGEGAGAFRIDDTDEIMGVNDRVQLAHAIEVMSLRIAKKHMLGGVTITFPRDVYIEEGVSIGTDTEIGSGVELKGKTKIGKSCIIGKDTIIENSTIGDGTEILKSVITDSEVGSNTHVGPFSYMRPGSSVGNECKVGDFVEIKNAKLGDGSKASHLAYIGDADVGKNVNIGCGVVFANYDGKNKYRSVVEDYAFIGSNANLVAPVHVESDAYVAAGTTVTQRVSEGALCVGRTKEKQIEGWVKRKGLSRKDK